MAPFKRLEVMLSKWSMLCIILIGSIPVIWELGARYEGVFFPVTVAQDDPDNPGQTLSIVAAEFPSAPGEYPPYVDVFVRFDKLRACEFLREEIVVDGQIVSLNRSLTWYDDLGQRLRIVFEENDIDQPVTRPTGEWTAGPWRLYGITSAKGTFANVAHRCHPLWLTNTQFHP